MNTQSATGQAAVRDLDLSDPRVAAIVRYFEEMTPASLQQLGQVYSEQARFKDPFNAVQGTAAIHTVFAHMFNTLDRPRFVMRDVVLQGPRLVLTWDFLFCMRRFDRSEQCVHGASFLLLAEDGRITSHRDYWDVAEELYEKLPLLGGLMRWLKRRASS